MWANGADGFDGARRQAETEGAKFSDYFDFSEPLHKLPSHRVLALFRGEKEEILDLQIEPEPVAADPAALSSYEMQDHAAVCDFRPRPAAATAGWPRPCAGPGAPRSRCISTSICDAAVERRRAGGGAGVRLEPARPVAGGARRRPRHHGPRPRLSHRGQGRRGRRHRQGGGNHRDLSRTSRSGAGTRRWRRWASSRRSTASS